MHALLNRQPVGGCLRVAGENENPWEAAVGVLMVRCPYTGRDFPSGVETDRLSFELTPAFSGTIRCPLCGVDHAWSKIDAWVSEGDQPGTSAAA
jgi:hypothetical protein